MFGACPGKYMIDIRRQANAGHEKPVLQPLPLSKKTRIRHPFFPNPLISDKPLHPYLQKTMKTLLVPTDFSENATNALQYAAALAGHFRGKIVIAHFMTLPVTPLESGAVIGADPRLEADCQQELDRLSKELRLENGFRFDVETICQYGPLVASLHDLVKTKAVDLVVMGTKGAANFLDKLVGTNTADFIKVAACPVLAIPSQAKYAGIRNIAYASDFEDEEKIFLQQLFGFAGSFDCNVSIVNIFTGDEPQDLAQNPTVREILQDFPDQNYYIFQISKDDVIEGLHEYMKEKRTDVLAVSIHERTFFEVLFHKSISKQLIYHTALPLLALPEKPYKAPVLPGPGPAKKSIPLK